MGGLHFGEVGCPWESHDIFPFGEGSNVYGSSQWFVAGWVLLKGYARFVNCDDIWGTSYWETCWRMVKTRLSEKRIGGRVVLKWSK